MSSSEIKTSLKSANGLTAPSKHPTGVQNPTVTLKIQVRSKWKNKKTATVLQRLPGQPLKSKQTGRNHSTGRMWLLCSHTLTHTHTYEPSNTVINSVSNICWQTNMYTHTRIHTHAALLPLSEGKLSPQFSDSHKKTRILLHTR